MGSSPESRIQAVGPVGGLADLLGSGSAPAQPAPPSVFTPDAYLARPQAVASAPPSALASVLTALERMLAGLVNALRSLWPGGGVKPPVVPSLAGVPAPPPLPLPPPPPQVGPLPPPEVGPLPPPQVGPPTPPSPHQRQVFVDYMPWFSGGPDYRHWKWTGHDPTRLLANGQPDTASALHPLIGPYDSQDDAVQGFHLLLMKAAGFDGADLTWYGTGSVEDQVAGQLYAKDALWAQQYGFTGFSLSIMPDEGRYQSLDATQKGLALGQDMQRVVTQLGASPVQLRLDGRPVVLPFQKASKLVPGQDAVTPADWLAAEQQVAPVHLGMETSNAGYGPAADLAYGWVQLGQSAQDANLGYLRWLYNQPVAPTNPLGAVIGVTYAGFDDSGVNAWSNTPGKKRVMDREVGGHAVLQSTWDQINAFNQAHPDRPINWVHTDTWNDWNEGTNIEPSAERGFGDLELAARNNYAFKGQAVPVSLQAAEQFALAYLRLRRAGRSDQDLAAGLMAFARGDYAGALAAVS